MTPLRLPSSLSAWICRWISKKKDELLACSELSGDGSTRQFFRLELKAQGTLLCLWDPDWIASKDYPEIHRFLLEKNLSVPRFYAEDPAAGVILMEDLGDMLLQKDLAFATAGVALLSDLHVATFPVPKNLVVSKRAFDEERYSQELLFTLEHLSKGFLNVTPSKKCLSAVSEFANLLSKISPQVFCHRDYHSRNLLVQNNRVWMIDFQDAMLGPPHYDLASFVYDPYAHFDEAKKRSLIEIYKKKIKPSSIPIQWNQFSKNLSQVGFQRLLKAAGSFASFWTRHEKKTHLAYIRPALETARKLAFDYPELSEIFPIDTWLERLKEQSQ